MADLQSPPNGFEHFVNLCWGGYTVTNQSTALTNISTLDTNQSFGLVTSDLLLIYEWEQITLSKFAGFCIYAVIFGLSFAASILCLYYLFKKWKKARSHMIVAGFTVFVSSYNAVAFGLKAVAIAEDFRTLTCPLALPLATAKWDPRLNLYRSLLENRNIVLYRTLYLVGVPLFIWATDAFLLYRAWVIWIHHRKYIAIPCLTLLASIVWGIIWLVQDIAVAGLPAASLELFSDLNRLIPTLAFSCGMDVMTTGMIAGRLIYHHRKQQKLTEDRTMLYMPIIAIFIESAGLSVVAKVMQLAIPALQGNPIVIPFCTVSTNLIVLRKALGADAGHMMAKGPQDLSALRFRPRRLRGGAQAADTMSDGSIPGVFEAHLIQTIGGRTVDIGTMAATEDSDQVSLSDIPAKA